jgi:hypothetical protein
VTNTKIGTDTVSFDVTKTGTPILVKVSYFPNWEVTGAQGPWRVGPNLMVVVPTSTHVSMHFGTTPVEYGSWAITLGGLVALVFLFRAAPLPLVEPRRWFGSRSAQSTDADADANADVEDDDFVAKSGEQVSEAPPANDSSDDDPTDNFLLDL